MTYSWDGKGASESRPFFCKEADREFLPVFSASYFPDAQIVLEWIREEGGGKVYRWAEKGMEGWFCRALLRYTREEAPARLFIQVKAGVA